LANAWLTLPEKSIPGFCARASKDDCPNGRAEARSADAPPRSTVQNCPFFTYPNHFANAAYRILANGKGFARRTRDAQFMP
jgi:hypothetical protein